MLTSADWSIPETCSRGGRSSLLVQAVSASEWSAARMGIKIGGCILIA
jgi:hypothetical protein